MTGRCPAHHPLGELLRAAARGEFPAPDGGWRRVPPGRAGVEAVVAFTGHAVLAVGDDVTDERLVDLGVDGFGGAVHPRVLLDLAGSTGWIDTLDAIVVAPGTGPECAGREGDALVDRSDLAGHSRTRFARFLRDDVRVLGISDPATTSIAVLGRGLAGLTELSFEIDDAARGSGSGRRFLREVLAAVPGGEPVMAAVAPGNAASLRCLLAAGFAPIGSVQLFTRAGGPP